MYEEFVTCGHQGKIPDDGSYPELIPAERETDHYKYKPVERCPAAEAAAERKKDIFDEPEQNSAVTWRAGDWTYQASFREETIFSRAAARSAFSL